MNNKTITVIHFVHTLYGGVANVATGLINFQYTLGYKTILAYCHYDTAIESQLNHCCEKLEVHIPSYPGASMLFGMRVSEVYEEYLKTHRDEFVVVHVHNVQTLGSFGNWKSIPIICTLHGFNCPHRSIKKIFSDYLYKHTLKKLLKYNKRITSVSKAIVEADECKNIRGRERISVIHNFAQVDINKRTHQATFNVGHVGDLSYEKGWDTVWNAYALLPEKYRAKIRLYAAGKEADYTGEWIRNEAQRIGSSNMVSYEGYIPNAKRDFISKLDLLVLASRNEGLGLVQIEAMGYGIPVLGRNTGGICEVLRDGYNGYVIIDEKDLSDRIMMLFENHDLYANLSRNAIRTYQEKFTTEIIMKKYQNIYDTVFNEYHMNN